jgi:hypothetical protein
LVTYHNTLLKKIQILSIGKHPNPCRIPQLKIKQLIITKHKKRQVTIIESQQKQQVMDICTAAEVMVVI